VTKRENVKVQSAPKSTILYGNIGGTKEHRPFRGYHSPPLGGYMAAAPTRDGPDSTLVRIKGKRSNDSIQPSSWRIYWHL
jgi:hypothetical protein